MPANANSDRSAAGFSRGPAGTLLFWLGGGLFMMFMIAGLVQSYSGGHWLPPVGVEYTTQLNALERDRGPAATLPEVRTAARIDFDNEIAVRRLLESARQVGNQDDELWALLALARLKPEDSQVRLDLAAALLDRGRPSEAFAQARFAVWLAPDNPDGFCHLGRSLQQLGRHQEAAGAYRHALDLDPSSAAARSGLQSSRRGN